MEHAVAKHEGITETVGKNGKTRFQAKVWFDRKFITSRTFDSLAVAKAFRETKLAEAVKGTLLPADERRKQRTVETLLDRPLDEWASLYIKENPGALSANRLYEYEQVGRLLAGKALPDFSGKAGGRLIRDLAAKWRFIRFTRGTRAEPIHEPDNPVSDQTLRLRLSALDCLLDYAIEQLPDELDYVGPLKLKNYAPPPAHSNKRKRLPTLDEYGSLLRHFGPDSDFGDFLRVIDDTGCRLSEVSLARGGAVTFFGAAGHVLGGVLTLNNHKTDVDVGPRQVPLSRYAAQILHARKARYGDGRLFPALPASNDICKAFDAARTALGIADLQIKDFRRSFITRNVRAVSKLELVTVVGQSSLIDLKSLSIAEQRTQKMAGHTDPRTTLDYVTPEQEEMAQVFTETSRWPAVSRLLRPTDEAEPRVCEASVALERELGQLLDRMRALGMTAPIHAVS